MQEQGQHSTAELTLDMLFTIVYTLVDDLYQQAVPASIRHRGQRNGCPPTLSDSEVITIALVGELLGMDSEKAWYGLVRKNYRALFPQLLERSRFNRRRRDLWAVINLIRGALLPQLGVPFEPYRLIDSVPIPVCHYARAPRCQVFAGQAGFGFCAAKDEKFYGFKLHLLITPTGVVTDFVLAAADPHDSQLVWELVDGYWHLIVLGDKGYVGHQLAEDLKAQRDITLLALKRKNQRVQYPPALAQVLKKTRRLIETVIGQLVEQFQVAKVRAKTLWGLMARLYTKLTAHSFGNYINQMFGLPITHLKDLVFN